MRTIDIAHHLGCSRNAVKHLAARLGLRHPGRNEARVKIVADSTLKGETAMKPDEVRLAEFKRHCDENGLPFDLWRAFWHKTGQYSSFFVNKEGILQDEKSVEEFLARLRKESPKFKARKYTPKRLLVPANMDIHIGKLCEKVRTDRTYHSDEAVSRVLNGQAALYEYAKPFGITDILLPLGNDVIHVDNNKNTTTNGTPQDVHGSVESMTLLAVEMYVKLIEWLAKDHDVWLAHVSSNHDRLAGWSVSQMVANRFWNDKRVHFNREVLANTPRKYFIYGENLIMFQHGDSKVNDVLGTILHEAREAVGQTRYTYCYQGDKHHKMRYHLGGGNEKPYEKDHNGVTIIKKSDGGNNIVHVETVRSPSEPDAWHNQNNYIALPAVEAFVHDVQLGQIARFTHYS